MEIQVVNNKEEVPLKHYTDEFAVIDPEKRARELGISYENGEFSITMYKDAYKVKWPSGDVECENPAAIAKVSVSGHILLLRYIISGKVIPHSGAFKAFRELPWGEVYVKPFDGRCIKRMAFKFNSAPDKFKKAAEALGGTPLSHSDAGFEFDFIDDYKIRFYCWEGDDEFPPSSQIEFSSNFAIGFAAEDDVVVAENMISAISSKMKEF